MRDTRPLQLKIRVLARPGIIESEADLLNVIEQAALTRFVPEGVRILWIDWKKGEGGEANEGHITEDLASELRAFWNAINGQKTTLDVKEIPPAPRPRHRRKPGGKRGRRKPARRSKGGHRPRR